MKVESDLVLTKGKVVIKTLSSSLIEDFIQLASHPQIWQHTQLPLFKPVVFKEKWFDKALMELEVGARWPFSIYWNNQLCGSSSYYDIDLKNKRLNIGYTWYHPSVWGTQLNHIAKFILLEYVFDVLNFYRVAFCVDQANVRACKSLKKLGAKQEGILHKHMIRPDGTFRNSVIFAITDDDWPIIKKQKTCHQMGN